MKITYLKLKNVAGIFVGMNKQEIEIDLSKSNNKIVAFVSHNAAGKTTLLSSMTPFATPTSVDERSTLSYILQHKDGYKEIHYTDGNDTFVIKHYFKASKESHTVKSYFSMNGEELNENGNVGTFNSLVEIHFGLTQEMMRLIRIGTNVNSFITLTPARRKEYIGKLIEEIDMYLKIYKKITEDIRVVKIMAQTNSNNLYNCHVQDPVVENKKLETLNEEIAKCEKMRDELIKRIAKLSMLMKDNNLDDLQRKLHEAKSSISDFEHVEHEVHENGLADVTIDDLMKLRAKYSDDKIDIQSKINSYRITIDSILKTIERIELNMKKITSDNDIQSLTNAIRAVNESITNTPEVVKKFKPNGVTYNEANSVMAKLKSFNQTFKMIFTLGDKAIKMFVRVKHERRAVDIWLQEQREALKSRIKSSDLDLIIDRLFDNDTMVSPICSSDMFSECPYYRFHEIIGEEKRKSDDEQIDDETLHYIYIINNNFDQILNEIDTFAHIKLPQSLRSQFKEERMLERLENHLPLFDLSDFENQLSLLNDWEIYQRNLEQLKHFEQQLAVYQKAGVQSQMDEITQQQTQISSYKKWIEELTEQLDALTAKMEVVDSNIVLVSKYADGKKYKSLFESTINETERVLRPLETAANERDECERSLHRLEDEITSKREEHHVLEMKMNEYNRLVEEGKKLSVKNRHLSIIQEAVSTKKGIPVYYMKQYLTKIQKVANELLSLIYGDEFMLAAFNVTPDTFEVPYVKNGRTIPDIKYASQSEVALSTMALSFALASNASTKYNILLADEIDSGLDTENRNGFLQMLYMQMDMLHAEQVFIISQNLSQMSNVPMDCIVLNGYEFTRSRLQHVVYE